MSRARDPIDRYVARLGHALDLPHTLRWRVLRETEAHLRETAAALEAEGLEPANAAQGAVERFGEVGEIARQIEDDRPPRSVPRCWRRRIQTFKTSGSGCGLPRRPIRSGPTSLAAIC